MSTKKRRHAFERVLTTDAIAAAVAVAHSTEPREAMLEAMVVALAEDRARLINELTASLMVGRLTSFIPDPKRRVSKIDSSIPERTYSMANTKALAQAAREKKEGV